jgi:hypothetical protein
VTTTASPPPPPPPKEVPGSAVPPPVAPPVDLNNAGPPMPEQNAGDVSGVLPQSQEKSNPMENCLEQVSIFYIFFVTHLKPTDKNVCDNYVQYSLIKSTKKPLKA